MFSTSHSHFILMVRNNRYHSYTEIMFAAVAMNINNMLHPSNAVHLLVLVQCNSLMHIDKFICSGGAAAACI